MEIAIYLRRSLEITSPQPEAPELRHHSSNHSRTLKVAFVLRGKENDPWVYRKLSFGLDDRRGMSRFVAGSFVCQVGCEGIVWWRHEFPVIRLKSRNQVPSGSS